MKRLSLFAFAALFVSQAFAQYSDLPVDSIEYSYTSGPNGHVVVYFDRELPREFTKLVGSRILLNRTARIVLVNEAGVERELAKDTWLSTDFVQAETTITTGDVADGTPAPIEETKVRIYFTLQQGNTTHIQKAEGIVIDATNAVATFQDSIDAYSKTHTLDAAKSDSQRDVFASMSVSVPSGTAGAQGNADLSFNHTWRDYRLASGTLFDQFVVGAKLKKSSAAGSDSRHFSLGFAFRKDLLIGNAAWRQVVRDAKNLSLGRDERMSHIKTAQDSFVFFAAALIDAGLQMEGDVKGLSVGSVSNLIANPTVRFVSPVWHAKSGLNAHLEIPISMELGYNLTNNDMPGGVRFSLARYMIGEDFTLSYDTRSDGSPIRRAEFSVRSMYRHLFKNEITIDSVNQATAIKQSGPTYYTEGSIKMLFASFGNGRPGFKISFKRGTLPPVYSFTKAFEFGLVFETTDDSHRK